MLSFTFLLCLSSFLLPWMYQFAFGRTPIGAPWPICRSLAPVRLNWRVRIEYRVECHASFRFTLGQRASQTRRIERWIPPSHLRHPEIRSGRGNKERNLPFRKRTTIRALPFCSVLTVLTDNDLSGSWICGLGALSCSANRLGSCLTPAIEFSRDDVKIHGDFFRARLNCKQWAGPSETG